MTKVAVVYHSGYGHTEVLAHKAAQGVRDGGAEAILLALDGQADNLGAIVDKAGEADAIIFGSPTYMGDVSAAFKAFAEASSKAFFVQGWKDKLAAGFTVSHSFAGDKGRTIESMATLAAQHGMVWVSLGIPSPNVVAAERGPATINRVGGFLGALAQADNGPADITPPEGDRETVRLLGERVALSASRWARGRVEVEQREAA
jgi:NAD(P)H dehydrogenase (quinone)